MPATGCPKLEVEVSSQGTTPTPGSLPQQVPKLTHGISTPGAIVVVQPRADVATAPWRRMVSNMALKSGARAQRDDEARRPTTNSPGSATFQDGAILTKV